MNCPMAKLNVAAGKITLFTAMEPHAQVSPSTSYVHMRSLNYLLFVNFLFEGPLQIWEQLRKRNLEIDKKNCKNLGLDVEASQTSVEF